MITKKKFVSIIERMRDLNDLQDQINELIRNSKESMVLDFTESAGIMITMEDVIVDLLEETMDDKYEDISYFIYELDYGREYEPGCISQDGKHLDFSCAESLYDYLYEKSKT